MAQFLFKFLDYIASDIIVKRLANNKTFQKFALTTDSMFQKHAIKGEQIVENITKTANEAVKNPEILTKNIPKIQNSKFEKYMKAFSEEIKKDFQKFK
jgi:hypothetical protein